jgi:cell division topological specificity factor
MGWLRKLVDLLDPPADIATADTFPSDIHSARYDAKNRLRLVLMHDRTQLSPAMLDQLRDDMVEVISKYVEIDKEALEVNLESDESSTIALVANIPVLRTRSSIAT